MDGWYVCAMKETVGERGGRYMGWMDAIVTECCGCDGGNKCKGNVECVHWRNWVTMRDGKKTGEDRVCVR